MNGVDTADLHAHKRAFFSAVRFLTVLPAPGYQPDDDRWQGLSLLWYPVVGLLLGMLLIVMNDVMSFPLLLQAALLLSVWVLLTGGLHLDGLADCIDAWFAGIGDRQRTMEVLKDPRVGTMAVLALVMVLLVKFASLTVLLERNCTVALLVVPMIARASLLHLFAALPYVREGGLGAILATQFSSLWARRILGLSAVLMFVLLGFATASVVLLIVALVMWAVQSTAQRRLEGFTGDVAGAQLELVELAALITLAALC